MNQSLKNPQLKKTLIRITLWMLLVTVAGCILFVGLSKLQAAQMMRQNIAMAGRMSTEDDAQNIAKLFTDPISEQDYEAGKALLSPYGVNVEMDPSLYQPYQSLLMQQLIGFCFLMLVLWGIVMLCCLRGMHGIFSQIRSLSSRVRQAADGNPKMLPAINEGDMQSLENSINLLVERSGFGMESLQADKMFLKNLLSDISHQLKTPLATLQLYSDLMLDHPNMEPAQREEFLQQSSQQLARIDWLIQGMLKMARLESGSILMQRKPTSLSSVALSAMSPFQAMADLKKVSLVSQIPDAISLNIDAEWTAEALGNLIKNALEHSHQGGHIRLTAKDTAMTVQLSVIDDGEGMESTELPYIFERFYRKQSQVKSSSVGIGLSLAKAILTENDADIYVKSAPGHGSEFVITFLKKSF